LQFLAFFYDFLGICWGHGRAMAWPWPGHGTNKSNKIIEKAQKLQNTEVGVSK
jgi:hypothetical protein